MELALVTQNGHISPLTFDERQRLNKYEDQIEGGLDALYRIKNENLWREYGSFEAYMAARWGDKSSRRRNQLLAGLRTAETLTKLLGTGVPINGSEFSLRPLVTLAEENPEKAVEVYRIAMQIANGETPSHTDVQIAKNAVLTQDEQDRKYAIEQINALRSYEDYVVEIKNGGNPKQILALVTLYESCEIPVRRVMIALNVRDITLIRLINDGFRRGSEVAREVLETGYIQFREGAIALGQATAKDYRRALDESYREHLLERQAQNRGQAISVVIFGGDAQGTFESLRQVLDYSTMIALGNLISSM